MFVIPDVAIGYVTRVVVRSADGDRVAGYELARVPDGWAMRTDAPHSPGPWRGPYESAEAAGAAARSALLFPVLAGVS